MKVAEILSAKSSKIGIILPAETIATLANRLRAERVGAMIVSEDGKTIDGIISERDVSHGVAEHGAKLPALLVSDLMTRGVITCSPDDLITAVARKMTRHRVRHLPVQDAGELVGIVSIGDVIKHRLSEMELEVNVLRDYAIARA
jgi:CBS domain-containing protein